MQEENSANVWRQPKNVFILVSIILLFVVVIVSILREKIVSSDNNQVSVTGQGKVSYQPDTANVSVGIQVDKAPTSEQALSQLNEKMSKMLEAVQGLGISREDIQTKNYSLNPQYDYKDGSTKVAGYNANQQVSVKVKNINENPELVQRVVEAAGASGSNQISGVNFYVADINSLKQEARILAIGDAKRKSAEIASAAGVELDRIVGWYENIVQAPDSNQIYGNAKLSADGFGGREVAEVKADIPSGTQEIIVEMNVDYKIK